MSGNIDVECTKGQGELFIDGKTCHRKAFCAMGITPLWGGPDQRGTDLLIPTMSGVLPMPRRSTVTIYAVPLLLDGAWTVADVATTNMMQGLRDTVEWMRANMGDVTGSGDGTRAITLNDPVSAVTYAADAHVKLTLGATIGGRFMRAAFELSVPSGALVET